MLAPVIPVLTDAQEDFEVYIAQSPNKMLAGGYQPNPKIDTTLNGEVTIYYDHWQGDQISADDKQLVINYKKGLLHGDIKVFTNDGKLYCEGQYQDNKKFGTWTFYHDNGKVAEQGEYDPKTDSSFVKIDEMIDPFLVQSFFEYGVDTSTIAEMKSAGIIPLLNVGYNRSQGRKGVWKYYTNEGVLVEERDHSKG